MGRYWFVLCIEVFDCLFFFGLLYFKILLYFFNYEVVLGVDSLLLCLD